MNNKIINTQLRHYSRSPDRSVGIIFISYMSKKNSFSFILALVLGVALAVGGSVWATSIGTNISVSGNLTTSGTSASSSVALALGVGTTTPSMMFSVGGAGGTNTGHGYFTGGLGVGISTTTAGGLETTGDAALGGALSVTGISTLTGATTLSGAATLSSTLAVTGLSTLSGGVLANNATSTITNLSMLTSTSTQATSSYLAVTSSASTTNFRANGTIQLGPNGSSITNVMHGFCSFGPLAAAQSIAATSTGTVACTTEAPTGLALGDKVWLTASTTASGVTTDGWSISYTGIASSTAAGRIQAMVYNGTGAAWTVTTSTWQFFIVK